MKLKIKCILLLSFIAMLCIMNVNAAPTVISGSRIPADGATGVDIDPTLSVKINSTNATTVYFMWNNSGTWKQIDSYSGENLSETKVSVTADEFDSYRTSYTWTVNVSDATGWTNSSQISFTTETPSEETADIMNALIPVMASLLFLSFLFASVAKFIKV